MKGFKEFIMRGNVMDLAIAVIIGNAFSAIVTALVENIFNPLIAAIVRTDGIDKVSVQLYPGGPELGIGAVIGAIIQFLLIAAVVYFVMVLPMNKAIEMAYVRKHGHKPSNEPAPTETDILGEIRDLLRAQQAGR